jgi:hypothetical protein
MIDGLILSGNTNNEVTLAGNLSNTARATVEGDNQGC